MIPYVNYIKIGLVFVALLGAFAYGWHSRDVDFNLYKAEVKATAEKQIAENESIKKQQEITTKGIQDEYDAKLALLRQYYANGMRQPTSTGAMSSISSTAKLSDAIAAYNQLASDCAATTLQTVTLQQWITEQMAIK